MLQEGTLTSGQARPLIGISNASSIAEEIVTKNYSARRVEFLVKGKKIDKSGKKKYDANIFDVQERIEKILGMKIYITNKKNNSGKITIEYKDLEQFDFLSNLLTKR
jgi:ParB family chromosome partitioning protein